MCTDRPMIRLNTMQLEEAVAAADAAEQRAEILFFSKM